jgi:hypothetical protein
MQTVTRVELDFEGDGWFRTEHTVWYMHRGLPFVLLRRGRLVVSSRRTASRRSWEKSRPVSPPG